MVITIAVLVVISFALPYFFPGDTLTNLSGIVPESDAQRAALEAAYKLDGSIFAQFWHYLNTLVNGNWGVSFTSQTSLLKEVSIAFPATIELITYALLISVIVADFVIHRCRRNGLNVPSLLNDTFFHSILVP